MVKKTKAELVGEVASLRQQLAALRQSDAERKRVQETLRESEECSRALFEAESDTIFLV